MKLEDINIRDPFILTDNKERKYYMYGSFFDGKNRGFQCFVSENLIDWSEPKIVFTSSKEFWGSEDFWAPEVHKYNDKYYLFGTFSSKSKKRKTQILVSDNPLGPFEICSAPIGPENWFTLDGTLYVENNKPYCLFSQEWLTDNDGKLCAIELDKDFKNTIGEPKILFKASETGWSRCPKRNPNKEDIYIVDAPFVYEFDNQKIILWSSWATKEDNGYAVGVAYPLNGVLGGKYIHKQLKLPEIDSGHPMIFKDLNGRNLICYHKNNSLQGKERAVLREIYLEKGELVVK